MAKKRYDKDLPPGLYREPGKSKIMMTYTTPDGVRHRESTKTNNKKKAASVLGSKHDEIFQGTWVPHKAQSTKLTFKEMMDKYLLEHVQGKKSQRSYEGYVGNLRSFFDHYKLSQITPALIDEYKERRLKGEIQGEVDGQKKGLHKNIKPATLNRDLAILRNAFNRAIDKWNPPWLMINPMRRVEKPA